MIIPSDWYWIVAGSTTEVWSSSALDYVPVADSAYVAWLAAGKAPSRIISEEELAGVLKTYDLFIDLKTKLIAYANAKQWALATGGYTLTVGSAALTFATDTTSQGLMSAKVTRLAQANPPTTVDWQFGPANFVTIAAADFIAAAVKVGDFVQATFDALKPILASVQGGSIATIAAIDAASWPANS